MDNLDISKIKTHFNLIYDQLTREFRGAAIVVGASVFTLVRLAFTK
jgi:hypothetical protein